MPFSVLSFGNSPQTTEENADQTCSPRYGGIMNFNTKQYFFEKTASKITAGLKVRSLWNNREEFWLGGLLSQLQY